MNKLLGVLCLLTIFIISCAGRDPNLVEKKQTADTSFSCERLKTEVDACTKIIFEKHHIGKKKMEETIAAAIVGYAILPPVLLAMDLKKADYKEMGAFQERRNYLIGLAQEKECTWCKNVESDKELMTRAEALYKKFKKNPQALTASISPAIVDQSISNSKQLTQDRYRLAIFPLNIYAATWGTQYIGGHKIQGAEGIATVASDDDRLVLKYCYKEFGNITEGVTLIDDVSKNSSRDVWKKKSFFSTKEPDWEEIRKIGLEIDTDLIVMIGGDIGSQTYDFYLYSPKNNKLYSVNAYAHYSHFGHITEKTVRALVDDFYNHQFVLAKEHPLSIQQDANIPKNNNGKILEQKLIEVDSKFKNKIDCYKIKYLSDGLEVIGFIVKPKKIDNKLPVIIFNRGGNREYSKITEKTLKFLSYYASQNYVILASQYRGNDGGQGREAFGGKDVNDVLSLIPLAQSISYIDSTKIVMLGASRGGMMTYLAIKEGADIRAAAVISGLTDLFQSYQERDERMKKVLRELVGDDENEYKIRSAYYWPEKINVPVLILHGEDDWRIKVSQAQKLSKKLAEAGKVHKLVVYPKGDHCLETHQHERDRRIFEWFETYLKQ